MEYQTFERGGQKIIADFNEAEVNWASFCAMPDKVQPVKMPSLFPVPTHIVRRRLTKTIDAYAYDKLMWSPEYVFGQGVLVGKPSNASVQSFSPPVGYIPQNSIYDNSLTFGIGIAGGNVRLVNGQWNMHTLFNPSGGLAPYLFDVTAPLTDAVSAGGSRLIGAVIEIEYLGKVDNIEGIVEIAMNTNTVNTKHTYSPLEDINFFSEDAIQQAPYYRRFRLSDGVRTIWFPMDEERFSFNECFQTVDRNDTIIQGTTTPGSFEYFDKNQTRCWIFPTKNIGSLHATVGSYYLPPGAHQYANGYADSKTPYRQDNESLHDKSRIEWAINFTGLTQTCPVRIYVNQYYETIPHEQEMDNFFPTKGPVGHTDIATKLIQQVSGGIAPSPSNNFGATVGNVLAKVFEVARGLGGFVANNIQTIGSIAGGIAGTAGGPIGSMAGSAIGNMLGGTTSNIVNSMLSGSKLSDQTASTNASKPGIFDSVLTSSSELQRSYKR